MSLLMIAWKSLRQRALSSSLTALSVALGVGLMVTVIVLHGVVEDIFNRSKTGFDLIVGAKGSPLQLVLNSIYLLDQPIENIPYKEYLRLKAIKRVEHAIPFALGDTTDDGRFRIVGTIPQLFETEYIPNRKFSYRSGGPLSSPFDAVIGSRVAAVRGWTLGSEFSIAHGGNVNDVHAERFKVVGVLASTGTPYDRGVFVDLEDFYRIPGHEKPLEEALAKEKALQEAGADTQLNLPRGEGGRAGILDEQKEVTAVLIQFKGKPAARALAANALRGFINDRPVAQAVNPSAEINKLMTNLLSNIRTALFSLTVMIVLVSGIGVFVSIYNSMSERRREIAIMRALGAGRETVLTIIVLEAVLICLIGGVAGFVIGHGIVIASAPVIEARSELLINPWTFLSEELTIIPGLIVLAIFAGLIPGVTAYRTDVARNLQS
jgi:putative ABC transport system permease protein